MKKLILSSVFAGLVLAASSADASTAVAPKKAAYGNFEIRSDFSAGWWANLHHKQAETTSASGTTTNDSIDKDDFTKRNLVALSDAKMTFKTEAGCAVVAFGTVVQLDMNAASENVSKVFRDTYVFGRFNNMIEVRIGSQRDAMYSLIGADKVQGGTGGYNGHLGSLVKSTVYNEGARNNRWVLDLTHANDTKFTNAIDVRTTRLAGFQGVINWKPSSAYAGRLNTYGDGTKTNEAQNNLVSAGLNYDNSFGDMRLRASVGGVYGISDKTDAKGAKIADQATSFSYRVDGILSWKSFDLGLGWLDSRSTGFAGVNKDKNAGWAFHGGLGYQFADANWKPRLSAGVLWGGKNGWNNSTIQTNHLDNLDQTLGFSGAVDFNIRDGFRWFVEGTWMMLDENNQTATTADKGFHEDNIILGTGLAISQ